MGECQQVGTADQLRTLFVLLTVQGFATVHMLRQGSQTLPWLYADYLDRDPRHNPQQAYRKLLFDIHERLADQNETMEKYGLPCVERLLFREVDRQRELFDIESQLEWLRTQPRPTFEQQRIIDRLLYAVESGETLLLFIHGFGDRKSTRLNS